MIISADFGSGMFVGASMVAVAWLIYQWGKCNS